VRRDWEPEDIIACWTLVEDDLPNLAGRNHANLLGFSLLLKFFELEGRFPDHAGEVPQPAVEYVAQQVKVPLEAWVDYAWSGSTIKLHRSQVGAADRARPGGRPHDATAPGRRDHCF